MNEDVTPGYMNEIMPKYWQILGYNPWIYRNKLASILPIVGARPMPLDLVEFKLEDTKTVYFVNERGYLIDDIKTVYNGYIIYVPDSITLKDSGILHEYRKLLPSHIIRGSASQDEHMIV
jgi:hypothetical protein